jgi:hypothetical protein
MDTHRNSPAKAGSVKLLWVGVAAVVIIVLVMGATLIHIQTQPEEPRGVVLPALEAPPANAALAVTSASTEAASSAAPLPPASAATGPRVDTNKPRIVQPRTSEPAVARAPQRVASKSDAVEGDTLPGVKP